MRIFSTFSGIGGFEIGIQGAYMQSKAKQLSLDADKCGDNSDLLQGTPRCVGYSEIDKYASSVYERNFRHGLDYPQRSTIRRSESDTQRNERQGLQPSQGQNTDTKRGRDNEHDRNELDEGQLDCGCTPPRNYGDITKIKAEELPGFDCLVGGFPCQAFSIAGKRKGFEDTRGTLFFDLARILRAKQPRLFVFENVKGLLSHDGGHTFKTIIATIDELGYDCQWQVLNSKNFGVPQNRERVYIVGHLRGTPRPEVFPIGGADSKDFRETGKVFATLRTRYPGDWNGNYIKQRPRGKNTGGNHNLAPTLSVNSWQDNNHLIDGSLIRRLTPKECERLQGFPDNWTAEGVDGPISDTQRYKMCGNAVTTNVVQAVFERILTNG